MIVADTNLVAYLLIDGVHTSVAKAVYARDDVWVVPPLWRAEFLNVLTNFVRAGLLTERQYRSVWRTAIELLGTAEQEPDAFATLRHAVARAISAYDAQFVVLARTLGTVLVTADRRLAQRCPEDAVLMTDYVAG